MGLFFHVKTEADKQRLSDYDDAVRTFRAEVSKLYEDAAAENPPLQKALLTAAEALRQRPLPSETNSSEDALRRMALSSLTIEMVFAELFAQDAAGLVTEIATRMREIGKTTTGKPEFKPLTDAAIQAVSAVKPQVAKDMEGLTLDQHLAELKRMSTAQTPRPQAPKGFRP